MDRFLHAGFLAIAILVSAMATTAANADGRISPGAVIPLDAAKASDPETIKEIISSCMYEEAMKGMFPELSNIESAAGTTKVVSNGSLPDEQRSRSGSTTTTTSMWRAHFDTGLRFDETLANGSVVQRSLDLNFSHYYGELNARIRTDFKDLNLFAYLSLPFEPAQLQVESKGGKTCGTNNWGREICVETPPVISAVNLVIPANFVAGANWINSDTGVETQKRFDYFNYADCILWKWEH